MTTQLTSPASVGRSSVLADHLGADSLVKDALMVLAGASLVGVLAQVSVPMWPVPITGQTLGVLLVGAILGARRGALSLLSYMLLGLAGMPWFSAASGGLAALAKPSFGYILGFIPAAWLIGKLSERAWDRHFWLSLAAFGGATLIPFIVGIPYMWAVLRIGGVSMSLTEALNAAVSSRPLPERPLLVACGRQWDQVTSPAHKPQFALSFVTKGVAHAFHARATPLSFV